MRSNSLHLATVVRAEVLVRGYRKVTFVSGTCDLLFCQHREAWRARQKVKQAAEKRRREHMEEEHLLDYKPFLHLSRLYSWSLFLDERSLYALPEGDGGEGGTRVRHPNLRNQRATRATETKGLMSRYKRPKKGQITQKATFSGFLQCLATTLRLKFRRSTICARFQK